MTDTTKPLDGIRVLDLTNVLAGPFCCHQLAHLGAEVIKIEAPGRGDLARQLGADPALNAAGMGVSFLAQNAGKASVTLNLKTERGRDVFLRLVDTADVIVENFRPGVMARLGLAPDALHARNPRLIICAISGFGQDGPLAASPAYDQIVQGLSGVMSITGDEQSAPLRVGYPLCDTVGGLTAAMAITAALAGRRRTDAGTVIDVSMLEATLATMGWVVSNFLIAGIAPTPNGNENITSAPSGTFQTRDAIINIAANKQEQFDVLCGLIGRADLQTHPDFKTREDRKANRYRLKAEIETVLTTRDAADWVAELNTAGVPAGQVLSVPDALAHPQVADRGLIATFDDVPGVDRQGRPIRTVGLAAKFDAQAPSVVRAPPVLGADTARVLGEIGIDADALAKLKKDGVI
ncbi:MAG: CoA transferase [Pseudomonadota bacterium]